ncbi:hypothetical protein [Mycobacterium triplex]|uniref:hypothetical protein n=1 Tax=Mycobacterium triplex TaxID=47839 RepID=UPI000567994A|nr:hypothetical protein [Mycobacterium triplex]
MNIRGAGHTRRWQPAIAVVAALGLFASLIAGSSLRSQFSAATLPEPAAWSQAIPNSGHAQTNSEAAAAIHLQHASSWDVSPAKRKPFHSMWMTHDRPDVWPRLASHSLLSVLPVSFAGTVFQSREVHTSAPAAECGDHEILALLCVSRS